MNLCPNIRDADVTVSIIILISCYLSTPLFILFQSRFADALLRELAGVTIPPERIYGLGTGLVFNIIGKVDMIVH